MDEQRYPIGRFRFDPSATGEARRRWIESIRDLPPLVRAAVSDLTPEQLGMPYRPGGWTVRQVVHHLPDSHAHAYIRFKLAATEVEPTIRVYDEARFAELPDSRAGGVEPSLALLETLHARWCDYLDDLTDEDFARAYMHPENGRITIEEALQLYAWHGRHHLAQITSLRERSGW